MALPKSGAKYRYTGTDPIGTGERAFRPETVVTVREVVDAGTIGAHDDKEDSVVIEWDQPTIGYGDNNEPVIENYPRAMSVSVERFAADFTKEA
jgi:hypothetical protein